MHRLCRERHDFSIAAMILVFFKNIYIFGSNFYIVDVVFVNTHSLLLSFHPKPSFLMHEGYVLWAVQLQILKRILNCIMLKCSCVRHHLQLYNII